MAARVTYLGRTVLCPVMELCCIGCLENSRESCQITMSSVRPSVRGRSEQVALTRVSWWMTSMTHRFRDCDAFKYRLAELDCVTHSRAAESSVADNYVGIPME